jgi:hypothetical protein
MDFDDLFDPGDFVNGSDGFDMLAEAATNASVGKKDKLKDKDQFNAIVLFGVTPSNQSFDNKTLSAMFGINIPTGVAGTSSGWYGYRVRIIDDVSPHAFYPLPCPTKKVVTKANKIIGGMHTLIVARTEDLNPGDTIIVKLNKIGGKYDLSYGYLVDATGHNEKYLENQQTLASIETCESLGEKFNNFADIFRLQDALLSQNVVLTSQLNVPGVTANSNSAFSEAQRRFVIDYKNEVASRAPVHISSATRTAERQAKAMFGVIKSNTTLQAGINEFRRNYAFVGTSILDNFIAAARTNNLVAGTQIVAQAQKVGINFSKHQSSLGIDIQTKNLSNEQVKVLTKSAIDLGANILLEPTSCWSKPTSASGERLRSGCKNEHLHISIPAGYTDFNVADKIALNQETGAAQDENIT